MTIAPYCYLFLHLLGVAADRAALFTCDKTDINSTLQIM